MALEREILTPSCERARIWVSLSLDDELSQLEREGLQAHLRRCQACADFALGVRGATIGLRGAALLQPEPTLEPLRRTAGSRRPLLVASAAAAVAAVALGGLAGTLTRGGGRPAEARASRAAIAATQEPYVEQSLLAMLEHLHPPTGRTAAA